MKPISIEALLQIAYDANTASPYADYLHGLLVRAQKLVKSFKGKPDDEYDSGWRFFSGEEDQAYTDDPENFSFYKINTIANYDPSIIEYLDFPIGSTLERKKGTTTFLVVEDN